MALELGDLHWMACLCKQKHGELRAVTVDIWSQVLRKNQAMLLKVFLILFYPERPEHDLMDAIFPGVA